MFHRNCKRLAPVIIGITSIDYLVLTTLAIIIVLALPPSESCKRRVNLESL